MPVGCGPSGNTCPRCPPHAAHMTSVRTMPNVVSVSSSTLSSVAGAEKAGQPHPESYFASELKSSAPHPAQWYVPESNTWSYSPVNGRSVPFSRSTWYCSGVSSARHCSSVFLIFCTPCRLQKLEIVTDQASLPRVGRVALAAAVAAAFLVSASAADADVVARPLKGRVVLRAAPGGAIVARLNGRTEFGSGLFYAVRARRGHWLGVIAPQRPNGVLSWIDARTVRTWRTTVRIDVSLSRRTLELIRGRKVVMRVPLGIGAVASPTPTGEYAVTDRLAGAEFSSAYGCCILALSAHQEHPTSTWNGGTRIAIHAGAPGAISNGCLHAPEGALRFLMTHVPLGTRVTIRA